MKIKKVYLNKFLYNNKINFLLGIIFALIKSLMTIYFAFLMKEIMNFALSGSLKLLPRITYLCIGTLFCYGTVYYAELYFQNKFIMKALLNYKGYLFQSIRSKDLHSFRKISTGKYLSVLSNDINSIEINYLENIFKIPELMCLLIGSLIAMALSNILFFLCVIAASALPLVTTIIFSSKIKNQEQIVSNKNENFLACVKDLLAGFTVIRCFKVEEETEKFYDKSNVELEKSKRKKRNILAIISVTSESSALIVFIIVFLVGAVLVIKKLASIGLVTAYIQLVNYIVNPINNLPQIFSKMAAARGIMDKTDEILENNNKYDGDITIKDFKNKIEFKNVNFTYDEHKVLKDLNLTIGKGKSYAVVGVSGSGKSTILNLLMGYYKNYDGSITIDENELSKIKSDCLYEMISVIQQDVFVFDDDIISNITMHRVFDEDKINFAIEKSGLLKFVEEKGREYQCGENGSRLSGGEKQRISIARCLLRGTPIILLDEATAALDNATAKMTENAILDLSNLTRIVVTHKLDRNMLRKYDEIIMINGGIVAEKGSFDELMSEKKLFYSLYNVSSMTDKIHVEE